MRAAGYDPARLPPGQHLTEKWPVLHAGSVPDTDLATWTLRVFGEVERELELSWESFGELPRSATTQDIHCVTRWSRFDAGFEGVHWRELAALCRPLPSARFAIAHAEHGFTANVPLAALEDDDALLATHADGEPLTREHGWPLRLVDPGPVLLEERQVAARDRALGGRPPGLLGALRVPQRRRPLEGAAVRLLKITRSRDRRRRAGADDCVIPIPA